MRHLTVDPERHGSTGQRGGANHTPPGRRSEAEGPGSRRCALSRLGAHLGKIRSGAGSRPGRNYENPAARREPVRAEIGRLRGGRQGCWGGGGVGDLGELSEGHK